jgi:DNA-binding beta-propeller fold protein YncE
MNQRTIQAFLVAAFVGIVACIVSVPIVTAGPPDQLSGLHGTLWIANRGSNTIGGFDATTGQAVAIVPMAAGSQPGDLAFANGRLYVAEEMGPAPAIAIVDPTGSVPIHRIPMPLGSRPHHVHASPDGDLVAFGLYGTDRVAVVDTATENLLGMWDTDPAIGATSGRAHAAVFSKDGSTLYVASDTTGEVIAMDPRAGFVKWSLKVPAAHELAIRDSKSLFVSRRTDNRLAVIDLEQRTWTDVLTLALPDTLRLSANRKLLTVGLRTTPAQVAVVDTATLQYDIVAIGPASDLTTIAGHQWTSPGGRYTVATFEGGSRPGFAVIDHRAGNRVIGSVEYPTRPHGVEFVSTDDEGTED